MPIRQAGRETPGWLVVMEAACGPRTLWAWCWTDGTSAGFEDVTFTKTDGVTIEDAPDVWTLTRQVFSVPACAAAVAS